MPALHADPKPTLTPSLAPAASTKVWIAANTGAPGSQEANITKLVRVLETNGGNLVADSVKWFAEARRGQHSQHVQ